MEIKVYEQMDIILEYIYEECKKYGKVIALELFKFKEKKPIKFQLIPEETIVFLSESLVIDGYLYKNLNVLSVNEYTITPKGMMKIEIGGFEKEKSENQDRNNLFDYAQYAVIIAAIYYILAIVEYIIKFSKALNICY